jgi:catechol 2,3-dioxygenase-like lactoylglutathione lyase family enzyme
VDYTEVFAGVAVADLDAGLAWYERLMGRPPDLVPNENEAAWRLAGAEWIYVVGDAHRAGNGLLALLVDDLDGLVSELTERGIPTGEIDTIPGAVRRMAIADPEGNAITFGQPLR